MAHNNENNRNNEEPRDPKQEKILWSSISRNGTILVEAGDDPFDGAVSQTAHGILGKKNTPGWEYFTLKNGDGWFGGGASSRKSKSFDEGDDTPQRAPKLKAVKFHVYEHNATSWEESDLAAGEPIVWVFAAVYNPEAESWRGSKHMLTDVQSFLEKIVGLTDLPRQTDPTWRAGSTLACQASFAPIMLQRMQEVTYLGTMARLTESLEGATELMQNNISAIMEREDQLQAMQEKSGKLNEMAEVFKKSSKGVRRRMMMQNAKHGVILGTVITAGVAVCVVPPLVAIL